MQPRMTRFEKYKSIKRIESYTNDIRRLVEQADIAPEKKQLFFSLLDQALAELRRRNTKPMRAILRHVESGAKSLNNSERDSKASATSTMATNLDS